MIPRDFPGKGKVAALRTSPETVLDDIGRLMDLAGYRAALPADHETVLKVNISWQTWYPACSTTPWQLEGVIRKLQADGYKNLAAAHNKTVVVDAYVGERNNKQKAVVDAYGLRNVHLYEPEVQWVRYTPKAPMLVLDQIFPEGILLPQFFFDKNIIHLPTVKTHVFTTITGAMKNAFGGLLSEKRHWTHSVIHETVVDLLAIQQEIQSGVFAVMDGTFAGDGPGPRAMRWHEKDILLASADQVAIDAVSAKIQGFNPMDLQFIRLGHELGLGVGDPKEIEVLGYDVSAEDWHFVQEDTFASRGQKLIYHGPLKPFENVLLRSPVVPWSYFASNFYHNVYWYPFVGRQRVESALDTKWGRLFRSYGDGKVVLPGLEPGTTAVAGATLLGMLIAGGLMLRGLGRRSGRSLDGSSVRAPNGRE
jgi:uncharacterized protein (DUF362 family)